MDMGKVVDWFAASHRPLPWREKTTTAWGVLVSEVMLQQTPVSRVEPVWQEWLNRWPTPADCAHAPLSDIITLWGRLGYPRRAKRLHEAARVITKEHQGELPRDLTTLLALPGVGEYTARAIRCFAYGIADPVVDTNVRRVLARTVEGEGEAGPPRTRQDLQRGQQALDQVSGTQAKVTLAKGLMELGAVICTARAPSCEQCPVASSCTWKARGFPPYLGTKATPQAQYGGSDRQARGIILRELRAQDTGVPLSFLETLVPDKAQFFRALESLKKDGLAQDSVEEAGHLELPR